MASRASIPLRHNASGSPLALTAFRTLQVLGLPLQQLGEAAELQPRAKQRDCCSAACDPGKSAQPLATALPLHPHRIPPLGPAAGSCTRAEAGIPRGAGPAEAGRSGAQAAGYLGPALGVLVVSGQHFEGDGDTVGPAVGAEGVPHGPVHGVVHHVQAGEGDKRHRPAAQLHWEVPLRRGHPAPGLAACEAARGRLSARRLGGPGQPLLPGPARLQELSAALPGSDPVSGTSPQSPLAATGSTTGSSRGSREAPAGGAKDEPPPQETSAGHRKGSRSDQSTPPLLRRASQRGPARARHWRRSQLAEEGSDASLAGLANGKTGRR